MNMRKGIKYKYRKERKKSKYFMKIQIKNKLKINNILFCVKLSGERETRNEREKKKKSIKKHQGSLATA